MLIAAAVCPHPPLLIGGNSRRAIRRAAELGRDGLWAGKWSPAAGAHVPPAHTGASWQTSGAGPHTMPSGKPAHDLPVMTTSSAPVASSLASSPGGSLDVGGMLI